MGVTVCDMSTALRPVAVVRIRAGTHSAGGALMDIWSESENSLNN
jgi:hypothetical protein